jgi:hypothetical protein
MINRRVLNDAIHEAFSSSNQPEITWEKHEVLQQYGSSIRRLKRVLSKNHIIVKKNSNGKEMQYLMRRTSQSVHKLHGMVSVALERCRSKKDYTRFFTAILDFDYKSYPYKDIATDTRYSQ